MALEIKITVGPSGVTILAANQGGQDGGNQGQVVSAVNLGAAPQKGGGGGPLANPGPGGGQPGSGTLVIGPIVVDGSSLSGVSQDTSKGGGAGPLAGPGPGGGPGPLGGPGPGGGSGPLAGPGPGGGGAPGPTVLVIGPVVIGAANVVTPAPVQNSQTAPAQAQ